MIVLEAHVLVCWVTEPLEFRQRRKIRFLTNVLAGLDEDYPASAVFTPCSPR